MLHCKRYLFIRVPTVKSSLHVNVIIHVQERDYRLLYFNSHQPLLFYPVLKYSYLYYF